MWRGTCASAIKTSEYECMCKCFIETSEYEWTGKHVIETCKWINVLFELVKGYRLFFKNKIYIREEEKKKRKHEIDSIRETDWFIQRECA